MGEPVFAERQGSFGCRIRNASCHPILSMKSELWVYMSLISENQFFGRPDSGQKISGLNSIRFLCAMWVVFGHLGLFPLLTGIDTGTPAGWLLHGLYQVSVSGPAAVIVFFLISGLCIHYPYRNGERPQWPQYYGRRALRLGLPMLGIMLLSRCFGLEYGLSTLFANCILWSLLAEIVYFTLYPLLLAASKRIGWHRMILLAFVAAYALHALAPMDPNFMPRNYTAFGPAFTWVLGLPCWLLGCLLAEKTDSLARLPYRGGIWRWRLGVWFASCLTFALKFHSPLSETWTLNLFAVLVFFWLQRELVCFRHRPPSRWTEWGGEFSYSIYLCHFTANAAFSMMQLPNLGAILNWSLLMSCTLAFSYLYYLAVENPAHRLARCLKSIRPGTPVPLPFPTMAGWPAPGRFVKSLSGPLSSAPGGSFPLNGREPVGAGKMSTT